MGKKAAFIMTVPQCNRTNFILQKVDSVHPDVVLSSVSADCRSPSLINKAAAQQSQRAASPNNEPRAQFVVINMHITFRERCGMVVCSNKVLGLNLLSVWSLDVLPKSARLLSGYSRFLPQSEDM